MELRLERIPAPNTSTFFWAILFDFIKEYRNGNDFWIVAEPEAVIPIFKEHFSDCNCSLLNTSGEHGDYFETDLNKLQEFNKQYDVVFAQAILEHVCRPSIVLENLVRACKPGGIIVLHTHGPRMWYHPFPIDCVRFYKDFFVEITKYLPLELLEFLGDDLDTNDLFICYRKKDIHD